VTPRAVTAFAALLVLARVGWVGHAPDVVDSALGAAAGGAALALAWAGRLSARAALGVGLAALAVVVGVAASSHPFLSWIMQPAAAGALAYGLAASGLEAEERDGAAWGLAGAGALTGVVALWQRVFTWPSLLAQADALSLDAATRGRLEEMRTFGLSLSPDLAAGVALLGLFAALHLARGAAPRTRLVALALAVCSAAQLGLARSNGAVLALLVGLAVFAVASGGRRVRLGVVVSGLLVVGVTAALGRLGALARSAGERVDNWRVALEIFGDAPLTGVGLFRFAPAYQAARDAGDNVTRYAHSAPVQWTAELGVVGLLLLAAAVVVIVARRPTVDRSAAFLFAGADAILVRACFDYDLQVGQTAALAAVAIALAGGAFFARGAPAPRPLGLAVAALLVALCASPLAYTLERSAALPAGERPDPEAVSRYLERAPHDDGALAAWLSMGAPGGDGFSAASARLERPMPPAWAGLFLAQRYMAAGELDAARAAVARAAEADPHHPGVKALSSALQARDE
jgi:hypothetical protein